MAKQIGAAVLPKGNSAQGSYRSQRAQNGQISVEDVDAKIQLPGIDWRNFLTIKNGWFMALLYPHYDVMEPRQSDDFQGILFELPPHHQPALCHPTCRLPLTSVELADQAFTDNAIVTPTI